MDKSTPVYRCYPTRDRPAICAGVPTAPSWPETRVPSNSRSPGNGNRVQGRCREHPPGSTEEAGCREGMRPERGSLLRTRWQPEAGSAAGPALLASPEKLPRPVSCAGSSGKSCMPSPGRAPGTRESLGTACTRAGRLLGRCYGLYSYPSALFWRRESIRSQCCPLVVSANRWLLSGLRRPTKSAVGHRSVLKHP